MCVFDIWVCLLCCCVQTPLHYAVHNGHADIALMLLEHGADPTLEDVCCVMCDIFGEVVYCVDVSCVFGEMWLCVICIFINFVVLVGVVGIWGQHTNHIFHLLFV